MIPAGTVQKESFVPKLENSDYDGFCLTLYCFYPNINKKTLKNEGGGTGRSGNNKSSTTRNGCRQAAIIFAFSILFSF